MIFNVFLRTHGLRGLLRPMIFLHSVLSNSSWAASGSVQPHQCHRTIFLLVFHEVRRRQPFLTLQSSVVFHPSYRRCAQTVLTFFSELHIQLCNVFVLFSANLVANSFLLTHFHYSPVASCLKYQHFSGVRYLYCPCFRSIKETRKDTRKPNIKTGFYSQLAAASQCF